MYGYQDLTSELLARVPELLPEYEREYPIAGDSLEDAHVSYGLLLNEFIIRRIEEGDNEQLLRRIFDFLEELAKHPDPDVANVVEVTVCERLGDDRRWLSESRRYMGPTTLALSHVVERHLGREAGVEE